MPLALAFDTQPSVKPRPIMKSAAIARANGNRDCAWFDMLRIVCLCDLSTYYEQWRYSLWHAHPFPTSSRIWTSRGHGLRSSPNSHATYGDGLFWNRTAAGMMGNLVAERCPLRPVRTKHLTAILTEPGFRHYSLVETVLKTSRRVVIRYIMVGWVDFFRLYLNRHSGTPLGSEKFQQTFLRKRIFFCYHFATKTSQNRIKIEGKPKWFSLNFINIFPTTRNRQKTTQSGSTSKSAICNSSFIGADKR